MARLLVSRSVTVNLDVRETAKGVQVVANGVPVILLDNDGYLRRLKDLPPTIGLRRLPDGRVAIKPKRNAASAARR